jgi:hypothetical protein
MTPSTPPSEEKEELETVAEITPTKDGVQVRGRKDIVDRIQKNFERDAIEERWEPTPPSRQGVGIRSEIEKILREFNVTNVQTGHEMVTGEMVALKFAFEDLFASLLLSHNQRLVEGIDWMIGNPPSLAEEESWKLSLSAVKALIEGEKT